MNMKSLADDDKPREKLLLKGREALSNTELLAIILGSGNKDESVLSLSKKILSSVDNSWNKLSYLTVKDLSKFKGIGEAKAISVIVALEIGRRKAIEKRIDDPVIKNSKSAFEILHPYLDNLRHEEFWCLYLNQANEVIHIEKLTSGGINQSVVDIRLLFNIALAHFASAIIIAHNHPSGNLKPSIEDIKVTSKIKNAGELLDVQLLDHLIIYQNSFYSFTDENQL
ncbi:DNA repair protein RadC [Elizabethkingia meningoseptica]|uniref:RadC family protein n=1 Tax=Elizabethkingia meningoseptica TaxID=238 RepID=UPI003891A9D9